MLEQFIAEHMRKAWAPGDVDCLLTLADWCVARGHPDPASQDRGTYHDEAGYQAIIAAYGGAIPFVESRARPAGLARTESPQRGDIGIVGSPHNIRRQWGAIFDGDAWRVRFINDFPAVSARCLAIWRV